MVQVHKNLYLDAADEKHFEGRYINDARGSKFKTNARFAANCLRHKHVIQNRPHLGGCGNCTVVCLHHMFIKFAEYVKQATEDLDDYIEAGENETTKRRRAGGDKEEGVAASSASANVVCLLTDSSESDDE